MQICTACGEAKELAACGFRNKARGQLHRVCKTCAAARSRQQYSANKAEYIARNRHFARIRTRTLQERLAAYLSERSCVDCGEADSRVLDFNHIDPAAKRDTIHALVHRAVSWHSLLAEIERCKIRCANCHLRRTALQFGWAKLHFSSED